MLENIMKILVDNMKIFWIILNYLGIKEWVVGGDDAVYDCHCLKGVK